MVAKNWVSAMGALFAIVAIIILLRDIALWGPDFVLDFMLNDSINSAKFVLIMFGISAALFVYSKRYERTRIE
ncbi:MAG: hypothetical protein RMJ59_04425 [Candidatus Nitrosocaldus sp.]|nr:hypothetical protein [Candidatus Nitrosocaldus sp.]MCS7141237.1 hypothetical protein [Candidatus Nitrosocaldus sp.]MDW8000157.1 hypothetical protein [Candidatus Nitrosocaldus sp.]MDW8275611.1 hypothetical protein [Candidatus Nitrosocaldus sp.]